jgi:hypothetical protein
MELIAKTPAGVRSLRLTHVAYVQGFITSLIGLARCTKLGIHFDSGRDLLYKDDPSERRSLTPTEADFAVDERHKFWHCVM